METMKTNRDRKKSYKSTIYLYLIFIILGFIGIIYLINVYDKEIENRNLDIYEELDIEAGVNTFSFDEKSIKDSKDKKIKANIKLPVIYINDKDIELNADIYNKYDEMYKLYKTNLEDIDYSYTYNVSFKKYINTIDDEKVLSIVITAKMVNDDEKKDVSAKVTTYNIDMFSGKLLTSEKKIMTNLIDEEYKEKIEEKIKKYLVDKKYIKEKDYNYTLTMLESWYIKDNKIHFVFDKGSIVSEKYGIIDIEVN